MVDFMLKMTKEQLTQRKLEGYYKLAQLVQWGRRVPVKFAEIVFGIEFL
jgi:hypothetical protein